MVLELIFKLLLVFVAGGALCMIAELMVIKTTLTPAKILVTFLLIGVALETFGLYKPLYEIFNAGISVPIIGFGASLAEGAIKWAGEYGILGAFAGGLINTAYGIGTAVVASYIVTLVFSPKSK